MNSKLFLITTFLLIIVPLASAESFNVEMIPVKDVVTENQAAIFNLKLINDQSDSMFEIFSFNTDFAFAGETLPLVSSQTETKTIKLFPKTERSGLYDVTLYIKKQSTGELKEAKARIRLITLSDAIRMTVEPELLSVNDKELTFKIKNTADIALMNIKIEADSPLFKEDFSLSLNSKEGKQFVIPVDLSDKEGGQHNINVKVYDEGQLAFEKKVPYNLEEISDFQEGKSITGFLIRQKTFTFVNEGNLKQEVNVEEPSTILEKMFSYFSQRPTFESEEGKLKANWQLTIEPYTTKEIVVKTNYLLPLIILILIIAGFAFTANYQSKGLIVTKTANRAKTNKGTAFKVTIRVKNRKDAVRELKVKDFLPKGLSVYEKFDFRKPEKITESYVEWHLPLLQGGEERVFTYHIYSMDDLQSAIILPNAVVNYLTLHREPMTEFSGSVRIEGTPKIKVDLDKAEKANTDKVSDNPVDRILRRNIK